MKIQKKTIVSIVLIIGILYGLLMQNSYAENETNQTNSTNTPTSSNTQPSNNVQNTANVSNTTNTTDVKSTNSNKKSTTTTTTKSNNANLSNLGIKPNDFKGFKPSITSYQVTVPEDTNSIEVYATAQHAKAVISGTGKKKLEKGDNKIEVVVTAEDGTKKTYTINVICTSDANEQQTNTQEGTENVQEGEGLAELKINDLSLLPEFKTNIYEYKVKYIGQDTKLDIQATPTKEGYIVEVTGNEDLQEGENIITILVSESNGNNVATYQVTVNKSLVDEEAMFEQASKKRQQIKKAIGISLAVVVLVILIIIFIKKRNENLGQNFSEDSFDENEEDDNADEMPKALKTKENLTKDVKEELEESEDNLNEISKEELKERFLNNYTNYEENYKQDSDVDGKKIKKHKGKRFK